MSKILNGRKLADRLNVELQSQIESIFKKKRLRPKLVTILVGEDPASEIYVNIKHKTCKKVGIDSLMVSLPESISREELMSKIQELNEDDSIHGILLQLPLPDSLKEHTSEFIEYISPKKDVDGFHPLNRGKLFDYNEELVACTPKGIIKLLEDAKVELQGKDVVIINRSNLVGKPLIFLFLKRNATITVCHTSTKDIESHMRRADILIVAVGVPNFVTKEKIKEGAILIDVGTNKIDGKLCGDVDFDDVLEKCGKITPVPGGVGPMTVSSLMQNTFIAFKKILGLEEK